MGAAVAGDRWRVGTTTTTTTFLILDVAVQRGLRELVVFELVGRPFPTRRRERLGGGRTTMRLCRAGTGTAIGVGRWVRRVVGRGGVVMVLLVVRREERVAVEVMRVVHVIY